MILPTDRTVFQNAWVVTDLEAAVHQWATVMKVGPFFLMEHSDNIINVRHRGMPGEMSMRLAIAQAGPVQIELIEVRGEGPNCYRDIYPKGRGGFHHMCIWTHDIDADNAYFEQNGYAIATQGQVKDSVRFSYYDTYDALGSMIEVMERNGDVDTVFDAIRVSADGWDGTDPLRSF